MSKITLDSVARLLILGAFVYARNNGNFNPMDVVIAYYSSLFILFLFNLLGSSSSYLRYDQGQSVSIFLTGYSDQCIADSTNNFAPTLYSCRKPAECHGEYFKF